MIYPDGSKYVGQWKEGMKSGRGVYDYANGDRYEGGWLEDAKHGDGVYYYNETGSKFCCKFQRLMLFRFGIAFELTWVKCADLMTKAVQSHPPRRSNFFTFIRNDLHS